MIEVSRLWCITPIDNEIMPFDNAIVDITKLVLQHDHIMMFTLQYEESVVI
jgi:hypothetical protein